MSDSAFQEIAEAVIATFEAEFAAEGFKMIPDRLHESLGRYRVDVGISPTEEAPTIRDRNTENHYVLVQFYDLWDEKIDPTTQVNPYKITAYAERFKRALRDSQDPGTGRVWYFDVDRILFPNDPTGNKSRFEMTIRAWGGNSNLIETGA